MHVILAWEVRPKCPFRRSRKTESAGPRHRDRQGSTETQDRRSPNTESAGPPHKECRALTQRAPWPDTETGRARQTERRGPTQGPNTESDEPRHRERRAPTQRALGPDTESAGPRHRERWAPTERAPGPDTKSAGPRFASHSVCFSKHACPIEVLLIKCW